MRSVAVAGLLALVMFGLAVACLDEREVCAQEEGVVESIPWPDEERAQYVWLDRNTLEVCGTGELAVDRDGDEYVLTLHFESVPRATPGLDDDVNLDTSVIVVDAETLQPLSVRRDRFIGGESEAVEGEYKREEREIRVVEYSGDDDPRTVPRRLDEDLYYDNESSLFIWRTIRLEEGNIVRYNTVLVNQGGTMREVELHVVELAEVEVPAGTFDAWRVDITAGDVDQVVFIADTPERQIVFYDNSIQIFELASYEP